MILGSLATGWCDNQPNIIPAPQKMQLGEPDASGRRKPEPVPGSDFDIEADTVIAAIGQKTCAPEGIAADRYGCLAIGSDGVTAGNGIYGAGDCVSGAATVVEALASGRRAALAVIPEPERSAA